METPNAELQPIKSLFASDDVIADILPIFVRNLSGYVSRIRSALDLGDVVQAARICHDLKGSAGGYGYPQIGELAQQLEIALKSGGETTQLTLLVEQIATTCQQALLGLDQ